MKNAAQYRNEINQLKKRLSPVDNQYFEDLQVYLSTQHIFGNGARINAQLLAMLQDLLEANQNGLNALSYFGHDPKTMADELLRQLPRPAIRSQLATIALIVGISWFYLLLSSPSTASGGSQLNLLAFIGIPLFETLAILLMSKVLHRSVYSQTTNWFQKHNTTLFLSVIFIIGASAVILYTIMNPIGIIYTIPKPWNILFLTITGIFSTIYFFRSIYHIQHKPGSKL